MRESKNSGAQNRQIELNEAAAPSLNPSMMSDTVFNVFKILASRFEV